MKKLPHIVPCRLKSTVILAGGYWLLIAVLRVSAQPAVHGDLSGTLPPDSMVVDGHCYVRSGTTLTIPAGAVLNFVGPYQFVVYGELQVTGTEQAPVSFTCDLNETRGGWGGLRFVDASDSCQIVHGRISNARGVGSFPDCFGGGVYLVRSSVMFDHCHFQGDSARFGGGAYVFGGNPVFRACSFYGNRAGERGGAVYASACQPTFERCVVWNNSAGERGGGFSILAATPLFDHCTLSGNSSPEGAALYGCATQFVLYQCIVHASFIGAGIHGDNASFVQIRYCDFFENGGGDAAGPGIVGNFGRMLRRNANGDSCDVYYNIFFDPAFADDATGDFQLSADSPCIDAGDPASPPDPDGSAADIGAFYFDQLDTGPPGVPLPTEYALHPNYPNPFNASTTIAYDLPKAGHISLRVFDVLGREVVVLKDVFSEAGTHCVTFDGSSLASGIYFARLDAGTFSQTKKLMLLR